MSNDNKRSLSQVFVNGIVNENPTFRLVLGTCPTLAVTTSAINGFGMGVSVIFVLLCSNIVVSLLRKVIPNQVRIPAFIVVIATFVTMLKLILQAYIPSLYDSLGLFLPLIVVNCIILARAEAFASKNPVLDSAVDGLGMGIGFTLALTLIGCVRELIGNGSLFGINILGAHYEPMLILVLASGGFLTYGILLLPFFLVISLGLNYVSDRTLKGRKPWQDLLITVLVNSVGLWICWLLTVIFLHTGVTKGYAFCNFILTYGALLTVPINVFILRASYQKTRTIWTGAVICALMVAWLLVSTSGMNGMYIPQSWYSIFLGR